ncbi:hypothetical protein DIPPA_59538 [Diplonema papillatum]|nr:hypothetical protein DIPPA_59538 [Diplonema papillatum]
MAKLWGSGFLPLVDGYVFEDQHLLAVKNGDGEPAVICSAVVDLRGKLPSQLGARLGAVRMTAQSTFFGCEQITIRYPKLTGDILLESSLTLAAGGNMHAADCAYEMPSEVPHMTFPTLELSICSFDAHAQCSKGVTMRGMVAVEGIETQMVITIARNHISFVGEGRQTLGGASQIIE